MIEVTEADKVLADAVAEAIVSVSVAYSHDTNSELRTINRKWFVHDTCEGNPFDKREWLAVFDNKAAANEYARDLRKERAYAAAATHRIEAAKAERDRLRDLPDDVALKIYNIAGDEGIDLAPTKVRFIATTLADALERQP